MQAGTSIRSPSLDVVYETTKIENIVQFIIKKGLTGKGKRGQ